MAYQRRRGVNNKMASYPRAIHANNAVSNRSQGGKFLNYLLLLTLVLLQLLGNTVTAQRLKRGCFEKAPLSCDTSQQPASSSTQGDRKSGIDLVLMVEEVCRQLVTEVFPSNDVAMDISLHEEYLNSIRAEDPFCDQIQQAYHHCLFCDAYQNIGALMVCQDHAESTVCGSQPTLEEVLEDQEHYPLFQKEDDVNRFCQELETAYSTVWIPKYEFNFPTSIDLCNLQSQMKHLCPGYCEGTCFDEAFSGNNSALVCDENSYRGPWNDSLDHFEVCKELHTQVFFQVDMDVVLNVSNHADFLTVIREDVPFCQMAQQAYSSCYWCAEQLCFGDHWPTSCEVPETIDEDIDFQHMCTELYYAFANVAFEDELNISRHNFIIPDGNEFCDKGRQAYHGCFWCAPPDVPIDFCTLNHECNSPVDLPDGFVSNTLTAMGIDWQQLFLSPNQSIPCDEIYTHFKTNWEIPFSLSRCYDEIFLARLCPKEFCEPEAAESLNKDYLGATNTIQKRALIWVSRVSAILSFLGGTYIIIDTLRDTSTRNQVFHQLIMAMAIFDIVTAFAWAFATAPIDKEEADHVEGVMGNSETCTAQAFFIQLGFTSIFYNVSLSVYYLLVIAYDWREFQLAKIRIYLHALPVTLGLALALGGLTQYHWFEYGCHFLPPPEGDLWVCLVFVVLPLGLSIIFITVSMLMVYRKVRGRAMASQRWSVGIAQTSRIQSAVFWQCLFYMIAFYVTWPILFAVYLASVDEKGPLGLTLVVAFVAPLQGFNNFLVYIRPKISRTRAPSGRTSMLQRSSKFSSSLLHMLKFVPNSERSKSFANISSLNDSLDVSAKVFDDRDPSATGSLQDSSMHGRLRSEEKHSYGELSAVQEMKEEEAALGGDSQEKTARENPLNLRISNSQMQDDSSSSDEDASDGETGEDQNKTIAKMVGQDHTNHQGEKMSTLDRHDVELDSTVDTAQTGSDSPDAPKN